jgi:broad specificity phosphatase PhoE
MTTSLLLIRHAETDLAGRFCGHTDPPVNEQGRRQIERLLERLKDEPIEAVYSSDLSRTFTTAQAIAQAFGLSPVALPGLREIYFGEWEALSWAEIEARDTTYARRWSENFPHLAAPGGESMEAFRMRVLAQVERLSTVSSHQCAAVVTHAGTLRVVLRALCGLSDAEAWEQTKNYCSVVRYSPAGAL